jgi:RNA polymerase sigma-70 factor (ECF subfamily)
MRKKRELAFSTFNTEDGENFLADTVPDTEPLPPEIFEQAENKKIVENLLEKISPDYREVLLLHYTNEFTFEDIGKILNKPLDTVKSQHRRALILLKKMLID